MRTRYNRKTSPKVIDGHVQRKNNHTKTARLGYVVDRIRPLKGFRHLVTKRDIHDFVEIIPDWPKISEGIESIILDSGSSNYDGLYRHYPRENTGIIWLSAWPEDLWTEFDIQYYQEHLWLLKFLGVVSDKKERKIDHKDCEKVDSINGEAREGAMSEYWVCYFSTAQARAFTLMHVFLHELGHHVDKLSSKNKNRINRGESFAEDYAKGRFYDLWPKFIERFGEIS